MRFVRLLTRAANRGGSVLGIWGAGDVGAWEVGAGSGDHPHNWCAGSGDRSHN